MPTSSAYPPWRRIAATGSLAVSALGLLVFALHEARWGGPNWPAIGLAGVTGAAAAGLATRSVLAQVLARGATWMLLAPTLLLTVAMLLTGQLPDPAAAAYALASGTALLLARPALHSDAARRVFAPVAFRRWFLAGAVAAAAMGLSFGIGAVEMLSWHVHSGALLLGFLAATLLASAVGVARMRAWGVLLAGVTSLVAVGAALATNAAPGPVALALAAFPGVMLALPVLASRLRRPEVAVEDREDARPRVVARRGVVADAERQDPLQKVRLAVGEEGLTGVEDVDLGRVRRVT